MALVAVLFTDAAGVRWSVLRRDDALPLRLLGLGLPLTMVLGAIGAWLLLPGFTVWELALVAVILAPTDAALGQPAIADPRVPATVRQGLNVESGLNDGIALPFFVVLLAAATGDTEGAGAGEVFLLALGLSTAVGLAVGWLGARLLAWSTARGWVERGVASGARADVRRARLRRHRVAGRQRLHHRLGGRARLRRRLAPDGAARPRRRRPARRAWSGSSEELGDLLASLSFFVFGAVLLGPALSAIDWRTALYAILSLTVVRMVPVAVALAGSHFRLPTVLYVGWFGPRGLASIVFALLLLARRPARRRTARGRRRAHRGAQRRPARRDRGLGRAHLRRVACDRGRGRPGPAGGAGGTRPGRGHRRGTTPAGAGHRNHPREDEAGAAIVADSRRMSAEALQRPTTRAGGPCCSPAARPAAVERRRRPTRRGVGSTGIRPSPTGSSPCRRHLLDGLGRGPIPGRRREPFHGRSTSTASGSPRTA